MTTEDWIKIIVQAGSAGVMVIAVLKFTRETKKYTDAVETIERVAPLVEGNPKEHQDQQKRDGLLGRLRDVEHREKTAKNLAELQDSDIEKLWKRVRAILRGMGVPSDVSDDGRVEREVKRRLSESEYKVDRLAAGLAMVEQRGHEQREPTGPHHIVRVDMEGRAVDQHGRPIEIAERVPRPPSSMHMPAHGLPPSHPQSVPRRRDPRRDPGDDRGDGEEE